MNSKRFFYINMAFLAGNVLLLALSVFFLRPGASPGHSSGFHAVKSEAPGHSCVGQLRLPSDMEYMVRDSGVAELEFVEIIRGGSSSQEGYDRIEIRQTLKSYTDHSSNFVVLRFCPEDHFWYLIYCPNYAERMPGYPDDSTVYPVTSVLHYDVPPDLLREPGLYAVGRKELGYCEFEIE